METQKNDWDYAKAKKEIDEMVASQKWRGKARYRAYHLFWHGFMLGTSKEIPYIVAMLSAGRADEIGK